MDLTDKNFSPKKLPDRKKRLAKGCTTLMYSCQQGKSDDIVTELRIKPKSVYKRDKTNKSALHYCCGQLDLVAAASITTAAPELLESADEDGLTPLHLAVIQGNMALVNLLLANKANVNAVDNEGHSVVHWAAVCGEVDALRALLANGADITKTDLNGGSPLHYAAQMSNGAGYQSHSANLALEILEIFLQQPNVQVDVCDKDGRQPLLWAASAGAVKAVLMLVKAGARVESADKDGLTALHCAASRGHTEVINVLINLCGAPTDLIDSNGCTALHYAVTLGHADATYTLLDLGADPNRQDRKGRTPAHCGCAKGQFETVKLLRDRRANMWLRNAKGDLPLHEAASSGRRELVLWLLDQRPKHVNTTSNDGRTILHIAAGNDYTDMCKMLIDFGADINSIYRLPGNVVQTPLDCALSKGHRSTAKFLQLHGGLPASKLRLSGRNPNALNDQELVKPLSFTGDKKQRTFNESELPSKKTTRNILLYVDDPMDSDANEQEAKSAEKSSVDESCNAAQTKRRSRKSCGCHYHYHHHYRHRCRLRSNSCERIEILQRDSGPDSAICRSKSNVEICLYHKRKSKNRRDASSKSTSTESSCSDAESSNSEYCHKSFKRKRDSYRNRDKIKLTDEKVSDGRESVSSKNQNNKEKRGDEKKERLIKSKEKKSDDGEKNKQKTSQQSTTAPTPKTSDAITMEKEKETKQSEQKPSEPAAAVKANENEKSAEPVTVQTSSESKKTDSVPNEETANKSIVTVADVYAPMDTQETQAAAPKVDKAKEASTDEAKAAETTGKAEPMADAHTAADAKSKADEVEKKEKIGDETKPESVEKSSDATERQQQSSDKNEKSDKTSDSKTDGASPKEKDDKADETNNNDRKEVAASVEPIAVATAKPEDKVGDKIEATNNIVVSPPPKQQAAEAAKEAEPNADDPKSNQTNKDAIATEESNAANDPSKSFQVLPNGNKSGDKTNQETDDTGNLVPPKETIRKTSFTVLKSDESIDDLLAGVDENSNKIGDDKQQLQRPKSFKVLNAHDASGEDILLQQSSDQETGGNEHDDDYLSQNVEHERSGKYSDSELMKFDGQLNGRRKKYKKRAKSVKQLTIVDGSQSKDQDSGFEPSPRTLRSQKAASTRAIYTANLPERPRVGDIVDGRSPSTRFEQRKPGDKNAVNMATVSQTLQRNIRRYYMEHKIFQHLLELKSLQIRSSKVNESLLVKRAVDDYHKSTMELGGETGGTLRRYPYKEYTFKNFEIFLYEVLKSLQKSGSNNFQNISDVYLEAERRLSPDYSRCKKAMYCTSKTHRCLHAAHAYTGIPCAAYIPMMNHHTIPKYGFGKTSMGSFYLPKICTKGGGIGGTGKCGSGNSAHNTVSLELSHGNNKQLITLPAEKLDNNKRYYVTFTLKENERAQQQQKAGDTTTTEIKK